MTKATSYSRTGRPGRPVGAGGAAFRRSGLHDRDDRLPGDGDRSLLRRAARVLHRTDDRKLRRLGRAPRVERAHAGGADAVGGSGGRTGSPTASSPSRRSTRARSSFGSARRGDAGGGGRRRGRARSRERAGRRSSTASMDRRLVARVSTRKPYVFSEGAPSCARRLRDETLDPAPAREGRCRRDRLPALGRARRAGASTASSSRTAPATPSHCDKRPRPCEGSLGTVPVLGICLGHQLLGLATGHETFKLPFGHRGANHPVLDNARVGCW